MLRTRRHGGHASADVHVLVNPWVSVSEGHMISVLVERRLKEQIDEITDVTVHIDPEDDENAPATVGLPMRSEAVGRLDTLWEGIAEATGRKRTLLHYLGGRIDVEVLLPLEVCEGQCQRAEQLTARMQAAAERDPVFRRVTAYFG
jgi:hypothetical protein